MAWLTVPTGRRLRAQLGLVSTDGPSIPSQCSHLDYLRQEWKAEADRIGRGNPGYQEAYSKFYGAAADLRACVAANQGKPDLSVRVPYSQRTDLTAAPLSVPAAAIRSQPRISEITPQDVVAMQTQDVLARTRGATDGSYKRLDLQQLGPGSATAGLPGLSWGDQTIYFPGVGQVRKQTLAVVGGVSAVGWLMALWGMTR